MQNTPSPQGSNKANPMLMETELGEEEIATMEVEAGLGQCPEEDEVPARP